MVKCRQFYKGSKLLFWCQTDHNIPYVTPYIKAQGNRYSDLLKKYQQQFFTCNVLPKLSLPTKNSFYKVITYIDFFNMWLLRSISSYANWFGSPSLNSLWLRHNKRSNKRPCFRKLRNIIWTIHHLIQNCFLAPDELQIWLLYHTIGS